jgi:hypothetical protein
MEVGMVTLVLPWHSSRTKFRVILPPISQLVSEPVCEQLAVAREGHRCDRAGMAFPRLHRRPRLQIPQPNRSVPGCRCQLLTVAREGHRCDPTVTATWFEGKTRYGGAPSRGCVPYRIRDTIGLALTARQHVRLVSKAGRTLEDGLALIYQRVHSGGLLVRQPAAGIGIGFG